MLKNHENKIPEGVEINENLYLPLNQRPDFAWASPSTRLYLARGYLNENEILEDRIKAIAEHSEKILGIKGFADKFYQYVARGWISLSSPIYSNYGKDNGLPISCFNSYVPDSIDGILDVAKEVGVMTKNGGGTSGYFGHIRPRGSKINGVGKAEGSFSFLPIYQAVVSVISQGASRRGMMACYIDVHHKDFEEWLTIRKPEGVIQNLFWGACISNKWMKEMLMGDYQKQEVWAKINKNRLETGVPYLFFTDNVNGENLPDVYQDKGYKVNASNLCTEIFLPSNEKESFVCCLLSFNLFYYDEWKDTDLVEVGTFFLDSVMSEFIEKAKNISGMERAVRFAERHRALGLGVLGWHSYLQRNMIPFESEKARELNIEIFSNMKEKSYSASKKLAEMFGEPEVLKGYGRRNTTLMTVAPTKSSSYIMGQMSASIEPLYGNVFRTNNAKIKEVTYNPLFVKLLLSKGMSTMDVYSSIIENNSIEHLDFLTPLEKEVFKSFAEISQDEVIKQAIDRQKFIDQGQSINLILDPAKLGDDVLAEASRLSLLAWKGGLKSLYYMNVISEAQNAAKAVRTIGSDAIIPNAFKAGHLQNIEEEVDCVSCQA